MSQVYIVLEHISYEGDSIDKVFSSKELADNHCKERNEKRNAAEKDYMHFYVENFAIYS